MEWGSWRSVWFDPFLFFFAFFVFFCREDLGFGGQMEMEMEMGDMMIPLFLFTLFFPLALDLPLGWIFFFSLFK